MDEKKDENISETNEKESGNNLTEESGELPQPEESKESEEFPQPEESVETPQPEESKETSQPEESEEASPSKDDDEADDGDSGTDSPEDLAPENIQRGRLVVGFMVVLLVIALAVIVSMPPLTEVTSKNVGNQFQMPSAAQMVNNPTSGEHREIAYAQVVDPETYHIEIAQKSSYPDGHQIRVTIKSDVEMVQPALKGNAYEVAISMKNMEVHVYDDDKEVTLASAGRLFSGIALYASIDPHRGMGNIVPEPNVNPQVRRVLYILADGIRQFYPALPEQPVGDGATYRFERTAGQEGRLFAVSSVTCHHKGDQVSIDLKTNMTQDTTPIGSGTTSFMLKDGKVSYGKSASERIVSLEGVGPERQEFIMEWALK